MTDADTGDHPPRPAPTGEDRPAAADPARPGADEAPPAGASAPVQDAAIPDWVFPPPPPPSTSKPRFVDPTMPASSSNQAAPLSPRRSSRMRGHHSSTTQRKLRRVRAIAWLLFVANLVALVVGIFGFGQLQRFRTEANTLASQARQLDAELTRARDRLTEMSTDMRVLLANRIPGIAQLGFGRSLEVNERYVRSLTFVRAGVAADQRIEYSMVVQNGGVEPVIPRVRILLFDEAGLQTGSAEVGSDNAVSAAGEEALAPGEARTYTGRVEASRDAVPAYFLAQPL